MRPIHLRLPAALAVALILAGCGLTDPYSGPRNRPAPRVEHDVDHD